MSQQNIYDNEVFFEGYRKIRQKDGNANDLFEIPALLSLLPDLKGKSVLDLGCGFGEHCKMFVERGARQVVGIDISANMLEVAQTENADPKIEYRHLPMEDLDVIDEGFDLVISSLALHYVEDFAGVVKNVYRLLNKGGLFIFSQEHPLVTCHGQGNRWTKDENGEKIYLNLSNYGVLGERITTWFVDDLKIYHRTFSEIINTLTEVGFTVEKMIEPLPSVELLERYPDHRDLFHKPDFLLLRVKK
jgi:SAM-dependent methyltransferase